MVREAVCGVYPARYNRRRRVSELLPSVLRSLPDATGAFEDGGSADGAACLRGLEERLGYRFANRALLRVALTLGSWANEHPNAGWPSNACLEFFGDAVLDLGAADALWRRFPELAEGELTRLRAALVDERSLAVAAQRIDLGAYLFLGKGDLKRGGRQHASTLADAVEAVIGAVFLDAREAVGPGRPAPMTAASEVFDTVLGDALRGLQPEDSLDPKSRLQQWAQAKYRITPTYVRVGEKPPPGDPSWNARVELHFPDGTVRALGEGEGRSLKRAERAAATLALSAFVDEGT